ncbi:hypothetical protein N7510_004527 [Penicillium lagena]|uniref:uncharacterized protein n=1 Tax=Penicillium lagena TaxID=94218 RepID=UPI002540BB9A|nr:uncharacterized protein N7510_004527 [Penicillium lagena]KAJ5620543.1 hypothetical protein N7510_004527 [Penicillium lagena]
MEFDLSDISDLSSVPSSPPPSERYLTPSSQEGDDSASRGQDPRPAKKRRRKNPLPRERTTQYLNLSQANVDEDQYDQLNLLVKTLRHQKDIVAIAGAGISTSAGIPDFRSTDGLFKSLQQKHNLKASGKLLFDAAVYQDDALTASFHEMVRSLSEDAEKTDPTAFHHMLARLGQESRLKRLYTQNIDGIETSMPPLATEVPLNVKGRWPVTIQLHGSLEKMVCQKCRYLCDFDRDKFNQPDAPACSECAVKNDFREKTGQRSHGVGRMRPRIVLYNEHNPDEEAITSVMNADIKSRPRVLIVAGTSLKIPGVRRLVKSLCTVIRSRKDGVTMWINNEPPNGKEFENCFDLIVQGSCDQVASMVDLKQWDDSTPYLESSPEPVIPAKRRLHEECSSSDVEAHTVRNAVSVVVSKTPTKQPRADTGLFTPSSSNDEKPTGKLTNPASRGRNLNDVLKANRTTGPAKGGRKKAATTAAASKKPARKPQASKVSKAVPKTAKAAKITSFTKVSKSSKTSSTTSKLKIDGKPMHPVPVGAARMNGLLFPGLVSKPAATITPDTTPSEVM